MAVGSAKDGFDAGGEFAGAEGLDEVVVSTDFEADDAVDLGGTGGEEDDRHVGKRADAFAELEAGAVGEANIEHDEGNGLRGEGGESGLAGGAPVRIETLGFQSIDERVGDGGLVFDDKNFLGHAKKVVCKVVAGRRGGVNAAPPTEVWSVRWLAEFFENSFTC